MIVVNSSKIIVLGCLIVVFFFVMWDFFVIWYFSEKLKGAVEEVSELVAEWTRESRRLLLKTKNPKSN